MGYRLADHVVAEPLVHGFHAWWCGVSPFSGAMHAARYSLPTLEAYLADPEECYRYAKDPRLAGSRFPALDPRRLPEVEAFVAEYRAAYADAVRFTGAVLELGELLVNEAKGQAMEGFYSRVPAPLRGLVELVYDYHNRPHAVFDEGFGYRSSLYKRSGQELRLFEHESDASRPFYVSTPRLPDAGEFSWKVPFADPRVRDLFALDLEPGPIEGVLDRMGGSAEHLRRLLVEAPPRCRPAWTGSAPRVTYIGHACILIERAGRSVLFDPFLEVLPRQGEAARFSYDALPPRIDLAVITHVHTDHFALEPMLRLLPRVERLVVPRAANLMVGDVSMRRVAEAIGYRDIVEVETFDSVRVGDAMELTATPFMGEHGDVAHRSKQTYFLRAGDETFYVAADSLSLEPEVARTVRRELGDAQTVFMNTETEGAPLSWPFDGLFPKKRNRELERTRRCRGSNHDEGLALLRELGARRFYNYAMGLEPWLSRILGPASPPESSRMLESERLVQSARSQGIEADRLIGSKEL